jgi:hypothetical protein
MRHTKTDGKGLINNKRKTSAKQMYSLKGCICKSGKRRAPRQDYAGLGAAPAS